VAFLLDLGPDRGLHLLECGPTTVAQLVRYGFDPARVTHLYLSHQHGDHSLGAPMLNLARWMTDRAEPLTLHGPREALEAVRLVTRAVYPGQEQQLADRVRLVERSTSQPEHWTEGDLRLGSAPARHGVPTVAFRFDLPGGASVVFSGDTASCDAVVELARGADLLLHDSTFSQRLDGAARTPDHSTAAEAGEVAARAGVRRLGLVHIPPALAERQPDLVAEAQANFAGQVWVPSDGETITFAV
jgi:ribonuclease Z